MTTYTLEELQDRERRALETLRMITEQENAAWQQYQHESENRKQAHYLYDAARQAVLNAEKNQQERAK
jgi:hypothetical protein